MRKVLLLAAVLFFVGLVVYLFITHTTSAKNFFNAIYLWLIGLAGIIAWPFKKLWDWISSEKELSTIEQDNVRLKRELSQIKQELVNARSTLEEERRENKLKIDELEQKIKLEDQKAKEIREALKRIQEQNLEEFRKSLKPDELDKVLKDAWDTVDFSLQ